MSSTNTIAKVPLMEQFYSIQGEGFHAGRPAVFIRLGGCDVGCVWCDVKESWEASKHPFTPIDDIVDYVKSTGSNFVVITGGEPAMYDLSELCKKLHNLGVEIAMETSGVYAIRGAIDWVCFSPKKFKDPDESVYSQAHELKVVIFHKSDIEWAQGHAEKVSKSCKLYLQPEWSRKDEMLPLILDFIKKTPQWSLSVQTHKYINVP